MNFGIFERKSRPKFPIASLTTISFPDRPQSARGVEYFIVEKRYWTRPAGHKKKQWVYSGALYVVENGKMKFLTHAYCVLEERIVDIV